MKDETPPIWVASGAELLDAHAAGWADQVDPQLLDILSPLHCVLGQVYGLYTTGLKALKMGYWGAPIHYGFCPRAMVEAPILEDLWRAHIKIRRDLAAFAAM